MLLRIKFILESVGIPSCFLLPISKQEEKGFPVPWGNQRIKHTHKQLESKMADKIFLDSVSK